MTPAASLADLRPGMIGFGPIGGLVPGLFPVGVGQAMLGEGFHVGELNVRHVIVVTAAQRRTEDPETGTGRIQFPQAVQAMPSGAEEILLTPDRHWTRQWAYVELPESAELAAIPGTFASTRGELIAYHARQFVTRKIPYGWSSYAALAAWRFGIDPPWLTDWIGRVDVDGYPLESICSVLADKACQLAGVHLFDDHRPHQCVTPGALAARLLTMRGTVWSGAGWAYP